MGDASAHFSGCILLFVVLVQTDVWMPNLLFFVVIVAVIIKACLLVRLSLRVPSTIITFVVFFTSALKVLNILLLLRTLPTKQFLLFYSAIISIKARYLFTIRADLTVHIWLMVSIILQFGRLISVVVFRSLCVRSSFVVVLPAVRGLAILILIALIVIVVTQVPFLVSLESLLIIGKLSGLSVFVVVLVVIWVLLLMLASIYCALRIRLKGVLLHATSVWVISQSVVLFLLALIRSWAPAPWLLMVVLDALVRATISAPTTSATKVLTLTSSAILWILPTRPMTWNLVKLIVVLLIVNRI